MTTQQLFAAINHAADTAESRKYGRQLASVMERASLKLRARFGGEPLWGPSPRKQADLPTPPQEGLPVPTCPGCLVESLDKQIGDHCTACQNPGFPPKHRLVDGRRIKR